MNFNFDTENILNLLNHIVFVEGSVIFETDKRPSISIRSICYVSEHYNCYRQYASQIIPGDLRITDENVNEYSPFTVFIATKGIVCYTTRVSSYPTTLVGAYDLYKETRDELISTLERMGDDISWILLKALYIEPFSRLEYYLINTFLCCLHHNPSETIKAIKKFETAVKRDIPKEATDSDKVSECERLLRKNIDSKRAIESLSLIFDIDLLMPDPILKGYDVRNSIVHRNGYDIDGNKIYITKGDVISISHEVDLFVEKLSGLLIAKEKEAINEHLKGMA